MNKKVALGLDVLVYLYVLGLWMFGKPTPENIYFLVGFVAMMIALKEVIKGIDNLNA